MTTPLNLFIAMVVAMAITVLLVPALFVHELARGLAGD